MKIDMSENKYNNERCNQFVAEMEEAGYEVEHYRGRNYWEGPSVRIESLDLQNAIRATQIKVQWDAMGRSGLVLYPICGGKIIEKAA